MGHLHNQPDEKHQDSLAPREGSSASAYSVDAEHAPRKAKKPRRSGTGEHHSLRTTSTDSQPVQPVANGGRGDETPPLISHEPEDTLPDQLDRNR